MRIVRFAILAPAYVLLFLAWAYISVSGIIWYVYVAYRKKSLRRAFYLYRDDILQTWNRFFDTDYE